MTGVTVLISHRVDLQRRSVSVLAEESGRRGVQNGDQRGHGGAGYVQREQFRTNVWWWGFRNQGQLPHEHRLPVRSRHNLPAARRLHALVWWGPVPLGGVLPVQMWRVRGVYAAVTWCAQPVLFTRSARSQTRNPRSIASRTGKSVWKKSRWLYWRQVK